MIQVTERLRLRQWLELESINEQLHKALDAKDHHLAIGKMMEYVSKALSDSVTWKNTVSDYYDLVQLNRIESGLVPMLRPSEQQKPAPEPPWEYPGRSWFAIANQFASRYGWSLEYIAELDVIDALRLIQEMQIDNQLGKEWDWALSDKSIVYDKATEKSKFQPLPRPAWMDQSTAQVKLITAREIPEDMKPRGTVLRFVDGKFVPSS